MPTLVEELAARHLGGALPADFIEVMAPRGARIRVTHADRRWRRDT
ncbi:MAG: hypothetical protein K1X87_12185 [Dehalococcoidia bacterium]|nr:hypothetical protein [Dehalococcoidia bacterium]